MLEDEEHQKNKLEEEIALLQSQLLQISFEADEVRCIQNFFACCGLVLSLLFFPLFPLFFSCVFILFKISVPHATGLLLHNVGTSQVQLLDK